MYWVVSLVLALFCSACAASDVWVIKIPRAGSTGVESPSFYPEALLALALAKTEFMYGAFRLEYADGMHSSDRLRAMLINRQGIDVMWSTLTPQREREMRSIDHDIFRGINGYRRLIIRAADAEAFAAIRDFADLRRYRSGVGAQWSDKDVFSHNQLPLVLGTRLDLLAKMLAVGRFDYLSRSVHEYEHDLASFAMDQLVVADQLLLHYCQPVKFFVNKNNYRLGDRLSLGLALAQADGSVDALFNSVPALQRARALVQGFNGRLISLANPVCIDQAITP